MLEVLLQGKEYLPRSVPQDHFIAAACRLCRMLGVVGRVILRVRNHNTGMLASTDRHDCQYRTIDFYVPNIIEEAKAKPSGPIRDMFAICLAHELVHASQDCRGSSDIPPDVEEHEALALEEVYGPVAMDIVKNGRLTKTPNKKGTK